MDDGLKQRLVGAVVLVAVAVIFVPSLFDNSGRRSVDLTTQVPPEPVVVAEPLELPPPTPPPVVRPAKPLAENYPHIPESAPETDSTSPSPDPAPTSDHASQAATASPQPTSSEAAIAEPTPPAKEPVLNEEGIPNAWSIQVGSFKEAERAEAFLETIRSKGYARSYVHKGTAAGATVYRVFVGPKINRQTALDEKARLDKEFNISSLIVRFEP